MNSFVWAEHDNATIVDATLSAITAATRLGDVDLLVTGHDIGAVAESASRIAGVRRVYSVDGESLRESLAETLAAAAVSLMADHDAFVATSTSNGKNIAPRVAALLDVMQITDVLSVLPDRTFTRAIYAGNAITTVLSKDAKLVVTVRAAAFERAAREGGSAVVDTVPAPAERPGIRLVGRDVGGSERPDLASAKIIVSGRRALQTAENFHTLLGPLTDKLGASIGEVGPRSTRVGSRTISRSGRPARSWLRTSMSRGRHLRGRTGTHRQTVMCR